MNVTSLQAPCGAQAGTELIFFMMIFDDNGSEESGWKLKEKIVENLLLQRWGKNCCYTIPSMYYLRYDLFQINWNLYF